jgi:type I restriction enzyme R subunit
VSEDNFGFLEDRDRWMAHLARQAESYVYSDPASCLFKLRLMVETMAKRMIMMHMAEAVSEDLGTMLAHLERLGAIDRARADTMHAIRRDGNAAVHGGRTPVPTAMRRLRDAHVVAKWFFQTTGDGRKIRTGQFVAPSRPRGMSEQERRRLDRAEALEDAIEQRRERTRRALVLYAPDEDAPAQHARLRAELEALGRVSAAAGEPTVDAESVMLVMALEMEQLLEHPRLGLTSRQARAEAERQLESVKRHLDDRERRYADERAVLVDEALDAGA